MTQSIFWKDRDGYDSIWFDPDDVDNYAIDFSRRLSSSESVSSQATTTEDNITIDSSNLSSSTVTVTISGDPGKPHSEVVTQVTLSSGRKRSHTVRVYERER